jgi:predicted NBD/HSP70 family sugar kinase
MTATERPTSAQPALLKDLNERAVLDAIRDAAPISRAEISRRARISKPTVSVALQSLLHAGLVREAEEARAGNSYGAVFFEPVPEAALVLGIDIGARFLRGALSDLRGTIRARQDIELDRADAVELLDAVARMRDGLVAVSGLPADRIDSVVTGIPGVVEEESGRVRLAENAHGLEGMAVGAELERRLGLPVTVENDVNLAALGEHARGLGRGVDDFAFVSVGTGLGAGLVLGGELRRGRHGAAGELDFVREADDEDLDPCAAALPTLAARLAAGGRAGSASGTTLAPPYDPRAIFAAARAGDPLGRAVVAEEARRIALHIVPIAAVADVALVVLGGGVGRNGDLLLEPVREMLAERLAYPPRVEVSSLGEAAVLIGALAVGLRTALERVFVDRRQPERRRGAG